MYRRFALRPARWAAATVAALACCAGGGPLAVAAPGPLRIAVSVLPFASQGERLSLKCYAGPGIDARPTAMLLHGADGFEATEAQYRSYAEDLVAHGYRACALLYFDARDAEVMPNGDLATRMRRFGERIARWARAGSDAVDFLAMQRTTLDQRVGLVGFSLGAYVAVAVAGSNARVPALVDVYGGVPEPLAASIVRMPATLVLHGDADTVVPVSESRAVLALARRFGAPTLLHVYPKAGHGFDDDPLDARAVDARRRVVEFLDSVMSPRR